MNYLLDTCLISELIKKRPKKSVIDWIQSTPEELFYLSVMTLGEIQKGISKLSISKKRSRLQNWLDVDLSLRFEGRVFPIDHHIGQTWGQLCSEAEKSGSPLSTIDSLIAATAKTHNLTVVTRNIGDFKNCGIELFNPWEI